MTTKLIRQGQSSGHLKRFQGKNPTAFFALLQSFAISPLQLRGVVFPRSDLTAR
jgi:hypothetical protein